MNNNGRYSINMYQDNNFHIKVNRNPNSYNNKINSGSVVNNHIQMNGPNYFCNDNKIPKLKKEELILKKMNKNKNKLQSLNNINNLSSILNKQKYNKINNSEKNFQKYKSERGIIDTLNNIRNNHRKLNNSNKINKSNSNISYLNTTKTKNNIVDYRTKINTNKNKVKNTLFKTSSFNNEFKNSLKNLGLNYNLNGNTNILIDDTTSNDTDVLTESEKINKETNLYVYRSEVQYPVKNFIANLNLPNSNLYNTHSNYTLKTLNDNNYKNNPLFDSTHTLADSISKSLGSSRIKKDEKRKTESDSKFRTNFLSPLQSRILSNKRSNIKNANNQNKIKSVNNSIKINDKFLNIQERLSPVFLNFSNEKINKGNNIDINERLNNNFFERIKNNNNAKSCHQFYRKQCFSKDKHDYPIDNGKHNNANGNGNINININNINNISPVKEKTETECNKYPKKDNNDIYRNTTNNIFLERGNEYNINNSISNYKYYNRIRNKKMNNQLKLISIFCDSVEKFLILVLKYYFDYFILQLKNNLKSNTYNANKAYNGYDNIKMNNNNNLLFKKLRKNNPKKLYYLEKNRVSLNLSNYKKYK